MNIKCVKLTSSFSVFKILLFKVKVSYSKRNLFLIWRNAKAPTKKFSAIENYVLNQFIGENKYQIDKITQLKKQLRNFPEILILFLNNIYFSSLTKI